MERTQQTDATIASMSADVALAEDHPLCLELTSLKEAVHYLQSETHRATIQLRHQSLEYTTLLQSLHVLEDENAHLRTELEAHRRAGPVTTHRDALQIQELTLALRRLSDKLDLTEKLLLEKNQELAEAQNRRDAAKKAEESAKEAVDRLRSELAASRARERELMNLVKTSEEQRKLSDLVVQEYANLVRSLEGRPSHGSQTNGKSNETSLDGLMHARQGLHKLLQDSNYDSGKLHAEINRLNDALDMAKAGLEAERAAAEDDRRRLAQAELDLHKLRLDDNAAAKMVSRYMKFSQSSSDMLHHTIDNLKTRQEALIASYEARLQQMMDRISFEKRQGDMLRRALDDLTEDISRESYGRRREIVLRLAVLAREQVLSERLRRWLLKSKEMVRKNHIAEDYREVGERILTDAADLLSCIDSRLDLGSDSTEATARICAAHAAVKTLQDELQRETDRRLYFEFQLATSTTQSGERPDGHATRSPILSSIRKELPRLPLAVLANAPTKTGKLTGDTEISHFQTFTGSLDDPNRPRLLVLSPHGAHVAPTRSEDVKNPDISCDLVGNTSKFEEDPTASVLQKTNNALCMEKAQVQDNGSIPSQAMSTSVTLLRATQGVDELEDLVTTDVPAVTSERQSGEGTSKDVPRIAAPTVSVEGLRPASTSDSSESMTCSHDDTTKLTGSVEGSGSSQPVDNLLVHEPSPSPASTFQPLPPNERYKEEMLNHDEVNGTESRAINERLIDTGFTTLLSRLAAVEERYANLQRAFRDCHLALQGLRPDCRSATNSDLLSVAVDRLSDYCEDARVELEIRIADEERIAKGFQILLSVPGAVSEEVNEPEVMKQIEAFIDGTDPAVRRAETIFSHKLDDLEHDVASVKRVLHGSSSPSLSSDDLLDQSNLPKAPGWPSWAGSVLGTSRSPAAAPTFGAVMTSPRLRHSSSTRSLRSEPSNTPGPFASLGLRIPMPSSLPRQPERPSSPIRHRGPALPSTVFGLGLRGLAHDIRTSSLTFKYGTVGIRHAGKDDDDLNSDIE